MSRGGWALAAVLALCAGCATGPSEPGTEISLRGGEEVQVEGTILRLGFVRVVGDSRCPVDVTCVWEGNAEVEVGIALGMGPSHPLRLNTTLDPKSATWNGVTVALVKVEPAPRAGIPIPFENYRITLRLVR